MKLLKTVPAIVMLAGGMFASLNAAADDSVFTVMDDPASAKKPFEGNLNAGYLAQSGNTKSSSLTADTTMTWYGQTTAWSLWGNASNTSSNDERSSEKYAAGGRSRFNLTDYEVESTCGSRHCIIKEISGVAVPAVYETQYLIFVHSNLFFSHVIYIH